MNVTKAYRGSTGIAPHILNLSTTWTLVISLCPTPFTYRERTSGPWQTGDWVDPQTAHMFLRKERFHAAARNQTQNCPASLITKSTEMNCL